MNTVEQLEKRVAELEEALAAEAWIIEAQALSLSPRALGKGRRKIICEQVKRMYATALGGRGRTLAFRRGGYQDVAQERLDTFDERNRSDAFETHQVARTA